jgi:hypothetical protein
VEKVLNVCVRARKNTSQSHTEQAEAPTTQDTLGFVPPSWLSGP